jgi:hypothetical protein
VALELIRGERTVAESAAEYRMHPTMIHQWKEELLESAPNIFDRGKKKKGAEVDEEAAPELRPEIGELALANDTFHDDPGLGAAKSVGRSPFSIGTGSPAPASPTGGHVFPGDRFERTAEREFGWPADRRSARPDCP